MSKHASAEDRLHINPSYKVRRKIRARRGDDRNNPKISGPPKGTNANNQFR